MEPPLQECVKGDLKKNLPSSKLWCRFDLMSHHPRKGHIIILKMSSNQYPGLICLIAGIAETHGTTDRGPTRGYIPRFHE